MISALKAIFQKPIDINNAINKVSKGIDQLKLTNEEISEIKIDAAKSMAEFIKDTASESTDRSITRRYLAVVIICVYMLESIAVLAFCAINKEIATLMMDSMTKMDLGIGFVAVIAFFFGPYMLKSVLPDFKAKTKK